MLSSSEIEKRYDEMYDLMSELMDVVTDAMKRIKKLEERMGAARAPSKEQPR